VQAQSEYLEALRNRGVNISFMIYDLLPIRLPDDFQPWMKEQHKKWLSVVVRLADGVICISQSVADELKEWLNTNGLKRLRPLKIGWNHLGGDLENSVPSSGMPADADKVLRQIAARPSFLMVGTVEPRKGHAETFAAVEQLWAESVDVNLVIVGQQGWKVEDLAEILHNHPEFRKRLFWLEGISDEYLNQVYASCSCLIAASFGEGFGLPLIEAAQHKLPVIARDIPVFREVAGDHAFYFKGSEPGALADYILKWLTLYKEGNHPRSDGMRWLTWKESAKQLMDIILNDRWYTFWE
jgi:glycosyltransferase involved in cell wall biosynthesis